MRKPPRLISEKFAAGGYDNPGIQLSRRLEKLEADPHIRPSSYEALGKIRPAFGGVQSGGNSSGIVDGAAAALVASSAYVKASGAKPLARLRAAATVGVPPETMGLSPATTIRKLLEVTGLELSAIDRFEINEAFAAQIIAVERELQLDRGKLNVNGGAIAIGHPLAATGIRLSVTLARELARSRLRYGVASACIGGGQGIALLLENTAATSVAC